MQSSRLRSRPIMPKRPTKPKTPDQERRDAERIRERQRAEARKLDAHVVETRERAANLARGRVMGTRKPKAPETNPDHRYDRAWWSQLRPGNALYRPPPEIYRHPLACPFCGARQPSWLGARDGTRTYRCDVDRLVAKNYGCGLEWEEPDTGADAAERPGEAQEAAKP